MMPYGIDFFIFASSLAADSFPRLLLHTEAPVMMPHDFDFDFDFDLLLCPAYRLHELCNAFDALVLPACYLAKLGLHRDICVFALSDLDTIVILCRPLVQTYAAAITQCFWVQKLLLRNIHA